MFPRKYHEGTILFICPTGTEQSILSSYCIVNLAVYRDDTWIEGIHIFLSLSSNLLFKTGTYGSYTQMIHG